MKKQITTVHQLRRFLDNYAYDTPVTFVVDNMRAELWEMYGEDKPIIKLRIPVQAQDHIDIGAFDWGNDPKDVA